MTRLGYVVVELVHGTQKPQGRTTAFCWDGGELFDTPEAAQAECENATLRFDDDPADDPAPGDLVYRVAEVTLVEPTS